MGVAKEIGRRYGWEGNGGLQHKEQNDIGSQPNNLMLLLSDLEGWLNDERLHS
jgi:hypothetical protein